MKVPFLDLKLQYRSIKDEVDIAIQQVFESCAFSGGKFVEQFEKAFSKFCQCKYAIGVGSGTEALWLALISLGIGPGDAVITVPNTFIATAEAVSYTGATPVFVDIDKKSYTMDPQRLDDYLKGAHINYGNANKPKAVIPVHLFGQPADMDPIMEIARKYELNVIEDACQAHGSEYKGKAVGSIGDAGCFSFYPGKNLGAYGEAGAITTNNAKLAQKISIFRDHGQSKKYYHDMIGWNARMDGLQGAVLNVKLKHLNLWNDARRKRALLYNELLSKIDGLITPFEEYYSKHVYHLYVVRTKNRDEIISRLANEGIYCGIHYPKPIHFQRAYNFLKISKESCPFAEMYAREYISLPMFPELTEEQQKFVRDNLLKYL